MFPIEIFFAFTIASLLLILSPGPDNLLAIARGLSQGRRAACISGLSSGTGILFHVILATFAVTHLISTSPVGFWVVKLLGAGYLFFLGVRVLRKQSLVVFTTTTRQPIAKVFVTGFLSAALNPKPGLFVLAFIPLFVMPARGKVTSQMLVYGVWLALLTAFGFSMMGVFASYLSCRLLNRPRLVRWLNFCSGLICVASGLFIVALKQK